MNRKMTALLLSVSMSVSIFASLNVTACAAEPVNVFTANNEETYAAIMDDITAYDSTAAPIKEIQSYSWGIQAKFDNNGYNSNTGIKINVSDAIKGKKGTFAINADFTCYYWGDNLADGDEVASWNQAKLFLETADGTQTAIAQGPSAKNGNDAALSGSIEYDATADTTYYLCITQPSGQHQYKNIVITYTAASDPEATETPGATDEPDETDAPDVVLKDTFATGTGDYTLFDGSTGTNSLSVTNEKRLAATMSSGWSDNNGIKKDITSLVETDSKYEVSADIILDSWYDNPAKLFFEVVSLAGDKTRIRIAEGQGNANEPYTLSGTAELHLYDGDTVYLCITQPSGYHTYDNITVRFVESVDPVVTEEPIENAIFTDTFSSSDQGDKYSLYIEYGTDDSAVTVNNGELNAAMGSDNGWKETNGIRRDITGDISQYISGMTFGVRAKLSAYWNSDANGKVFFEVVSNGQVMQTAVADFVVPDGFNGSDVLTAQGTAKLSFKDGDKVYLCITQMSGNHVYDDITMWMEADSKNDAIPLTSGKNYVGTYFPESGADVIFQHTFEANAEDEIAEYSVYSGTWKVREDDGSADIYQSDGGVFFLFEEDSNNVHGVQVDVTDVIEKHIPNGGTAIFSFGMKPWYWWGSGVLRLKVGDEITRIASYKADDPKDPQDFETIGDEVTFARKSGEKVKLIMSLDSSSAAGFGIDDVTIALPYNDLKVRDIAVSSIDKLDSVSSVDVVYGGKSVAEAAVEWSIADENAHVVYGTTELDGVKARAIITDSAVKLTATANGVSKEDYTLEYGKSPAATNDGEIVFLIDDEEHLNLISAVSGDDPSEGASSSPMTMRVSDNGIGITIEGRVVEAANNDEIILIYDADGNIVKAEYIRLASDGSYSVNSESLATGNYKAVMTDTLVSAEFSYATEAEFGSLREKINNGDSLSAIFDGTDASKNRITLGASTYTQLDKLSASDKAAVYSGFKSELGNKSRGEAADLFDALVTVKAAASEVGVAEWTEMLKKSAATIGLDGTNVYELFTKMTDTDKASVKNKVDAQDPGTIDGFKSAFEACVLNTALINAGYYTNVETILKNNADLFSGVNISNVGSEAAKYILKNINSSQTTISALTTLIKAAISNAASASASSGGGGSSSGGGGSSGGSGISGTNLGAYTNGTSSNTVNTSGVSVPSNRFNDLSSYKWAETAIYALLDRDIVDGYGDGTYRPGENVSREAFVKLIVTAFDIGNGDNVKIFSDVASDRWSYEYISAAASAGIVTGVTDETFMPEAVITRQDAAVIIYRALEYKGKTMSSTALTFTDSAEVSDYAADAVSALSGLGIINGMDDGSFAPAGITSRAQAAVMIYRVISTLL